MPTNPGTVHSEVCTIPGDSVKQTTVFTPAASSKTLGTLSVAIVAAVVRIVVWAASTGTYLNYNAAASSSTIPIPTTPTEIHINAADLALMQFLGNASINVYLIQAG